MKLQKTWTSKSNKNSIDVEIGTRGNLTGTITNKAGVFKISRITVAKGKKVAPFTFKGKIAFQVLPDQIYNEIDQALRSNFVATKEERIEQELAEAEKNYQRALNISPVEAHKWLDRKEELYTELKAI